MVVTKGQMIELEQLKKTFVCTDLTSKVKKDPLQKEVIQEKDPLGNLDGKSESGDSDFVMPKRNNVANWDEDENSVKINSISASVKDNMASNDLQSHNGEEAEAELSEIGSDAESDEIEEIITRRKQKDKRVKKRK